MGPTSPARPSPPLLELRNASFRLGDRLIFENTSWIFQRHEHWAVLGPNGSGKSLLADGLRGRLPLVRGELNYYFHPPPGLSHEEAIGHVSFEDRQADVHETIVQSRWNSIEQQGALSVGDFLSYERVMEINPFEVMPQRNQARARFARRRRQAIALLQLESLLNHSLLSLSDGERQRVQLARALCQPLRLLLLDEPFVGLDGATRRHFGEVLENLMASPLRILLLSTRAEDLPRHITHVLRLDDCRVITSGPRRSMLRTKLSVRMKQRLKLGIRPRSAPAWASALGKRRLNHPEQLFRLRDVTVGYGETIIVRGINWTVWEGESWALLGPNGSGKTTLLSLILGDHPHSYVNDISVFGRQRGSGESIWDLKRQLGWVSPELHLHYPTDAPCLDVVVSGFHQTMGLFQKSNRIQRAAALRWLKRFQLLDLAREPLFALSAGLQRMVLLARALVKQPRLLILDEPCQGLDSAHRGLFIRTIDGLIRGRLVTAIYVTHRPEEIPPSITRVMRLGNKAVG